MEHILDAHSLMFCCQYSFVFYSILDFQRARLVEREQGLHSQDIRVQNIRQEGLQV